MDINSVGIRRGDVFFCNLDKKRPCVIISNNQNNIFSDNITVIGVSSSMKRLDLPAHVELSTPINGKQAMVLTECIYTVPKTGLLGYSCSLRPEDLLKVEGALIQQLGL
jgi:mRNA-degrading endonuclease toxin of MazEF toxin-antitoxin module